MQLTLYIALIFALMCGAMFSSVETAIVAIPESKLVSLAKQSLWAEYAIKLKSELQKVLIFNLFGNSLANAALTTVSTAIFVEALGGASPVILTLVTLLITFIIIIFSEATPKVIASKSPTNILKILAIPTYYMFIVSKPVIWIIDRIVYLITRLFNLTGVDKVSLDEVRTLVLDSNTSFLDEHRKIVKNTIDFQSLLIKDVVIPLRQVEMINIGDEIEVNLDKLKSSHHSSVIVFNNDLDNIVGYIKVRDLLALDEDLDLNELVRPINYVHDFLPIITYLPNMQRSHEFVSVVVNEYGNILGIATIVDMIESVFGSFASDAPFSSYLIVENEKKNYTVDGATLVRSVNERLAINLPIDFNALSINGLLLKHFKSIPPANVCIKINSIIFEIIQVDKFGIEKVKLLLP